MQLRQRSSAQRAAMVEAPIADSDLSDAEEGSHGSEAAADDVSGDYEDDEQPEEAEKGDEEQEGSGAAEDSDDSDLFDPENPDPPVRRKNETRRRDVPARKRRQYDRQPVVKRVFKPALIDTVITTVGRVDLFDAASLKALRATCKAFCELVDSTRAVPAAKFNVNTTGRCAPLEAWAGGGRYFQQTETLSISGKLTTPLSGKVMAALCALQPPISKLVLDGVGDVGEILLTVPFEGLTDLSLLNTGRHSKLMKDIVMYPALEGLTSLCFEQGPRVTAATLVDFLKHFPDLESLKLASFDVKGASAASNALQNAFTALKKLQLDHCGHAMDRVGLCGPHGPALPALCQLTLDSVSLPSETRPWIGQLTSLSLKSSVTPSAATLTALNSGLLQKLTLDPGSAPTTSWGAYRWSWTDFNWSDLNLPHLTKLFIGKTSGDIMGDVRRATLPALRTATLCFTSDTTTASVQAFAAAFPQLRELNLEPAAAAPADNVVQALGFHVLPLLESFRWNGKTDSAASIAHNLMPTGPADGQPRWPRLQMLHLQISYLGMNWGAGNTTKEFYENVARAGAHFPALQTLIAVAGYGMSESTVDAFVAAAKELGAWPLLKKLQVRVSSSEIISRLKLKEMWPAATVA